MIDKYNDLYEWGGAYNRRLFLWFLAFLAALFFFNEWGWWLFIANAKQQDLSILENYRVLEDGYAWESSIMDLYVDDAE
jgi:hypothetical protein